MKIKYYLLLCLCAAITLFANAQQIQFQAIANGFDKSVAIGVEPITNYFYIVEQNGKIWLTESNGNIVSTPFLDISSQVLGTNDNYPGYDFELGLLGIAFHPNFDLTNKPYCYVNYTRIVTGNDIETVVSRFTLSQVAGQNYLSTNVATELEIITFDQPYSNHNGGDLTFGPDGYLYIGTGDGGSGNDPDDSGQDLGSLLGKILRIDVDNTNGAINYSIPNGNMVGAGTLPEIYSYGLRNPWRYSFDSATGDLWIADVGQNAIEEINFQASGAVAGVNYGWRCYEGTQVNNQVNQNNCPSYASTIGPVFEYFHDTNNGGQSVTGGFVYRGCNYPDLYGQYIFADYVSGNVWLTDVTNFNTVLTTTNKNAVSSFAENTDGEVYYVTLNGEFGQVTHPNTATAVSFTGLPSVILDNTPATLVGSPAGGTFMGNGIVFSAFNPAISGPGTFAVTYEITNGNCTYTAVQNVLVGEVQYNFVNYNLGTISP